MKGRVHGWRACDDGTDDFTVTINVGPKYTALGKRLLTALKGYRAGDTIEIEIGDITHGEAQ